MNNKSGFVVVAMIGWALVALFVGWETRGIVVAHKADNQLAESGKVPK